MYKETREWLLCVVVIMSGYTACPRQGLSQWRLSRSEFTHIRIEIHHNTSRGFTSSWSRWADGRKVNCNTFGSVPILLRLLRVPPRRTMSSLGQYLLGELLRDEYIHRKIGHLRTSQPASWRWEDSHSLVAPRPLNQENLDSGPFMRSGTCSKNS